jgi:UDP-glucose 4-epimerase
MLNRNERETPEEKMAVPKKWLITGGCGFIGTSLIRYLRETVPGVCIRVLDNLTVGSLEDLNAVCDFEVLGVSGNNSKLDGCDNCAVGAQLIVGDIKDANVCLASTAGMEVVIHLAANTGVAPSVEDPRADMEANVIGIFNMLEAARKNDVKRFVFASSGAPIGEVKPPIHEELAAHPVSPYGASKLAGEGYCSAYYRSFRLETVSLRFGNVYGPGSGHKNSVVAKFIKKAMRGQPVEIYGDGKQTRDFIYIEDLARAIILAVSIENIGGEVFQIATNSETTVDKVLEVLRKSFEKYRLPFSKVINTSPRIGDVKRNFSDTSKSKRLLGWTPNIQLKEGIEKTVKWFKEN